MWYVNLGREEPLDSNNFFYPCGRSALLYILCQNGQIRIYIFNFCYCAYEVCGDLIEHVRNKLRKTITFNLGNLSFQIIPSGSLCVRAWASGVKRCALIEFSQVILSYRVVQKKMTLFKNLYFPAKLIFSFHFQVSHKLEFHQENRTHRAASGRKTWCWSNDVFRSDAVRCVRFPRWNSSFRVQLQVLSDTKMDVEKQFSVQERAKILELYFVTKLFFLFQRQFFREFPERTNNPWPPYSPDLNPPDYFLWGYLKDRVYQDNPDTIERLKETIRREIGLVEWGFYALSASKAIFRARTYNCNLFRPVMMITWWMKLGGNRPPGDNPLLFSTEIGRIPRDMLERVVNNFNVRVAAVIRHLWTFWKWFSQYLNLQRYPPLAEKSWGNCNICRFLDLCMSQEREFGAFRQFP